MLLVIMSRFFHDKQFLSNLELLVSETMLTLNVIGFVMLLMLDAGNMQIAFPKNDEIQLPNPRDAQLYLGLKTLVNLKEENAVVSPANIYSCLWLLYSGARGDTKTEVCFSVTNLCV